MLRLLDISKTYSQRVVLRGVNLELKDGEAFVLFGPNGAGKSTLLKIAAGLMSPNTGRVEHSTDSHSRSSIFYIGHRNGLYNELTVLENIRFFQNITGNRNSSILLREILMEFGLWQRRNDPVKQLSQGMKRRLSLMKGFIIGVDLLLLDEPFSGLDIRWKEIILERLRGLKKRGVSLLMVTHLIKEGLSIADRIGLLENGILRLQCKTEEITEEDIKEILRGGVCR